MRTIVIDELTDAEKLDLIGELWDSLDAKTAPLTRQQIEEVERRLETADEDAARGETWGQIKKELGR